VAEIEAAFQHWWNTGNVREDWRSWTNLYTPDADYVEHFWGTMHGRDEIGIFIHSVMQGVPEMYTVLEWYIVGQDRVALYVQNRRDNPSSEGPPYFDFAQMTSLFYAGDGLWSREEAFWSLRGARASSAAYDEAARRSGATPKQRMTRKHRGDGPSWTRADKAYVPSWVGGDIPPVRRPSELRALLAAR
jgi:hypothetical protein